MEVCSGALWLAQIQGPGDDILALVAPAHDVVGLPRILESELAWHTVTISERQRKSQAFKAVVSAVDGRHPAPAPVGKKAGDVVNLDGYVAPIGLIFQTTVRNEGTSSAASGPEEVLYSFSFASGPTPLMVRWNGNGISFYRGKTLPGKEVEADFAEAR